MIKDLHDFSKQRSVCYFAYLRDPYAFSGVIKKINQTVAVLNKIGFCAQSCIESGRFIRGNWFLFWRILNAQVDILLLRNNIYFMPFIFIALLWQRFKGAKIIIEVPTPNAVAMREIIMMKEKGLVGRILRVVGLMVTMPWCLYPAHKIIQYAQESWYFSIGLGRKMEIHANGIDLDSVQARKTMPKWPSDEFVLIGVASLAPWHAFDRVIRGIAQFLETSTRVNFVPKFIVVGEGAIRAEWEKLASKLGVSHHVEFVGHQSGAALDALFDRAHVAVATLGLFRKNLQMASDLKSREYTARGIPFIAAGYDLDFDPVPDFVFKIANDDSALDIEKCNFWYDGLSGQKDLIHEIRNYAIKKLDFVQKIERLIC